MTNRKEDSSINTSFFETVEKNSVLESSGPMLFASANTIIGQRISQRVETILERLRKSSSKQTLQSIIHLLDKMLDYPEFLNMENYVLDELFVKEVDIGNLFVELQRIIGVDLTAYNPRNILSLIILSSRLSQNYMIRTNPERQLYLSLLRLFDNGNGDEFTSQSISQEIRNFITSRIITRSYIINLLNGNTIYNIYRANYLVPESEIRKEVIVKRLQTLLYGRVLDVPVSYLFNHYTNIEKDRLNKNTDICSLIASYKTTVPLSVSVSTLPPSVFSVHQEGELDFDKMSQLLYKMAPEVVKKKMSKGTQKKTKTTIISSKHKKPKPILTSQSSPGKNGTRKKKVVFYSTTKTKN